MPKQAPRAVKLPNGGTYNPDNFNEGEPASAARLDRVVRSVMSVPRAEILKRDAAWQKGRKKVNAKRARAAR